MFDEKRAIHSLNVANYMKEHAKEYGLGATDMFLLGWVHDIGYVNIEDNHYNHDFLGSCILSKNGYTYCNFVENHSLTPREYMQKYGLNNEKALPVELILLWEADMMVGQDSIFGFQHRLEDISIRYGEYSKEYISCKEKIEWLEKNKKFYVHNKDK